MDGSGYLPDDGDRQWQAVPGSSAQGYSGPFGSSGPWNMGPMPNPFAYFGARLPPQYQHGQRGYYGIPSVFPFQFYASAVGPPQTLAFPAIVPVQDPAEASASARGTYTWCPAFYMRASGFVFFFF